MSATAETPYGNVGQITDPNVQNAVAANLPQADCGQLIEEVGKYTTQVAGLGAKFDEYSVASTSATELIKKQQNFIKDLLKIRGDAGKLQTNQDDLEAKLQECRKKSSEFLNKLAELDTEIEKYKTEIAALKGQANPLQAVVQNLVDAIKGHEAQLQQIENLKGRIELEAKDLTGDGAAQKMETLKTQLSERGQAIKEKIAELTAQLATAQASINDLTAKIADLEKQLADCQGQKSTTGEQIVAEEQKKTGIEDALKKCQDNQTAVREAYKTFCTKQSSSLQTANAQLDAVVKSFDATLNTLKQVVADASTELASEQAPPVAE